MILDICKQFKIKVEILHINEILNVTSNFFCKIKR